VKKFKNGLVQVRRSQNYEVRSDKTKTEGSNHQWLAPVLFDGRHCAMAYPSMKSHFADDSSLQNFHRNLKITQVNSITLSQAYWSILLLIGSSQIKRSLAVISYLETGLLKPFSRWNAQVLFYA
jgi:hypothetical protein